MCDAPALQGLPVNRPIALGSILFLLNGLSSLGQQLLSKPADTVARGAAACLALQTRCDTRLAGCLASCVLVPQRCPGFAPQAHCALRNSTPVFMDGFPPAPSAAQATHWRRPW